MNNFDMFAKQIIQYEDAAHRAGNQEMLNKLQDLRDEMVHLADPDMELRNEAIERVKSGLKKLAAELKTEPKSKLANAQVLKMAGKDKTKIGSVNLKLIQKMKSGRD